MKTNSKRMRYLALALLLLAAGVPKDASAAVVAIPGWDVTVSDNVTNLGGFYRYQYTILNTGATDFNYTDFLINEAVPHPAGIHHEYNVVGSLSYDNVPEALKLGLSSHNYDWGGGIVAAGSSVTFGFDDVHGPTLEYWGIDTGTTTFTATAAGDRLAVPVPEPGTVMLMGIGALGMFGVKNAKRREAEVA